jgi:signal transduction histidine kinase
MEQRRNHQRNLLLATVDSQERERNKVGRELHDMVGANMAVIKQKVDKQNKELRNILHHTIEVIRNLSHGLMTPHVKQEEFADEISELCILSSTEKLVVRSYFHNWEGFRINKESATHLYRIVQELLQNAIKHSQANRIYIQFLVEDSKLILMYDDNGIGFGDNSHFRKGIGLMNIESRVKLLNGEIDYNNKPDTEGVSVMMEFPEFQN